MKKQYKSSKIKNKKIQKNFFDGGSLKRLRSLLCYFYAPVLKDLGAYCFTVVCLSA